MTQFNSSLVLKERAMAISRKQASGRASQRVQELIDKYEVLIDKKIEDRFGENFSQSPIRVYGLTGQLTAPVIEGLRTIFHDWQIDTEGDQFETWLILS